MLSSRALVWDISPLISSEMAVFPGDQPFSREVSLSFEKGDHLELSAVKTTLHLGAHADAECHYHPQGSGIEKRSLHHYVGLCQVIQPQGLLRGQRIGLKHIDTESVCAPRVLFSTGSFPDPHCWNTDFNSLSPELIKALAGQGVVTLGIDTPSIDPSDSKDLPSHQSVHDHGLAVLEGLQLNSVPEGLYILMAAPLNIKGADASPVRALLYAKETDFSSL